MKTKPETGSQVTPSRYVRMVIGEMLVGDHIKDVIRHATEMFEQTTTDVEYSILSEDGGNMFILNTTFKNREECLRFHSSREYRAYVAATNHLMVGNYVVKLFREVAGTPAIHLGPLHTPPEVQS